VFLGKARANQLSLFAPRRQRIDYIPRPGWEAEHLATIDLNHGIEPCRVRLRHAPESDLGQFNRSIIVDDEVQARI